MLAANSGEVISIGCMPLQRDPFLVAHAPSSPEGRHVKSEAQYPLTNLSEGVYVPEISRGTCVVGETKIMSPVPCSNRAELRSFLQEVLDTCPVDRCNPGDCPLYPLRKMVPTKRWEWFDALPEDDLMYLAAYHYTCVKVKLASRSARLAILE